MELEDFAGDSGLDFDGGLAGLEAGDGFVDLDEFALV